MPPKPAEQLARNDAAIEALHREEYKARDIAWAGTFVTLMGDGSVRIERDFIRTEDEPKSKAKAADETILGGAHDAAGLLRLQLRIQDELMRVAMVGMVWLLTVAFAMTLFGIDTISLSRVCNCVVRQFMLRILSPMAPRRAECLIRIPPFLSFQRLSEFRLSDQCKEF
jgi:hypothetical protein